MPNQDGPMSDGEFDSKNLRFYATLFELNQWQTQVFNWRVFESTLRAIADRIDALQSELELLRKAVQSKHDYGPASPGEQEAAWHRYCGSIGWNPNAHPSAKNAYVNGFCDGDSFSEGDEGRAILRAENEQATEYLGRLLRHVYPDINLLDTLLGRCTQVDNGLAVALKAAREQLEKAEGALKAIRKVAVNLTCTYREHQKSRHPLCSSCQLDAQTEKIDAYFTKKGRLPCEHDRLNEDGICRRCGEDRRSG